MTTIDRCVAAGFMLLAASAAGLAQSHTTDLRAIRGAVKIDGSSTVAPITEAVAEEFARVVPQVKVTVGVSGTGGGFKRFTIGDTDISDASRPIKKEEAAKAAEHRVEFVEIPVAYDGLSIVVNPKNNWVDFLTLDEVRRLFVDGTGVHKWSDVRPGWPDRPIRFYAPGTDSGTFDYFKEVVGGDGGAIRGDMSVSEDDNVLVKGVIGDENAIGFFGCAYYFENESKLKVVPIDAGYGPVKPTRETIESGTYTPFSRPLFIYVNVRSLDRPEVRAFVDFYLNHAAELSEEVGYVRLPERVYAAARLAVEERRTGTRFLDSSGNKVMAPLTEVFR